MKRSITSPLLTGVLSLFLVFAFQSNAKAECHAIFGYSQTPGTLLVTFHDSSTSSFEITTWHWDFGDDHSSNDHNITHTYSAPGTYEVCLTIHDNHDCNDTYCHAVVVQPIQNNCSAFFEYTQTPNTLTIHFVDGSQSNHDINAWSWTFGDGGTSDNHAPTHIYDQPGTYEVCLTIHDNTGCTSTYCHNVIVAPVTPGDCMAFFGYYQDPNTLTIHFIDSSSSSHDITTWHWDFGDDHSSNDHNISHTYSASGTYEVCLTIHDNTGCTDTYCTTVTVLPESPGDCNALFSYEQISGTQNIHFTNLSTSDHDINSNLWSFGDGHNGDGQNPTHEYQNPGTYEVCLIIHDNTGCTDTFCLPVIVEPVLPGECQASFVWTQNPGTQTVHFESTSTSSHEITSYSWSFGDGHNGDAHSPNHTYENAGTYNVCLIIHDNTGCTDTFCLEITVELVVPGPCEALFQWYQIAGTQTIHFVDSSFSAHDIISYSWNFGDGHEGDGQNPNHYYPVGTYEACLTIVDNTGCTDTYCDTITVEPEAPGDCMALFGYFQGENTLTIHFIDSSSSSHDITTWHWDFGDGHTSNDHNITHTYSEPGTYEVCLTIHDNHDCSDTYCIVVTVNSVEAGNCEASFEYSQAENSLNVHFFNTSTSEHDIISRFWTFGDGSSGDGNNPHHIYNHPGTYLVCLTIHDNSGCVATHCDSITVNSIPEGDCQAFFTWFQIENSLTIHFQDSSFSSHDITTWFWDFGDGHQSHDHFITHTYSQPGTYEVCLTIHTIGDCNDTYCTVVTVSPIGGDECQAAFLAQIESSGLTITLTNTSTNTTPHTTYLWEFGDGTTSTEENPVHTYSHTDNYTVCLFITDTTTECESHVCQIINAHPFGESHNSRYYFAEHSNTVSRGKFKTDEEHVITIYPNPTSDNTSIEYDLKENADVNIELCDLYGYRVRQVLNEKEIKGMHKHIVDAGNLSPGIYIFKVRINQEIIIRKITITQ